MPERNGRAVKKKEAKLIQFNMRMDPRMVDAIDQKAKNLESEVGQLLTRSDIIRMAVARFVNEPAKSK